jgi:hypothetical protein
VIVVPWWAGMLKSVGDLLIVFIVGGSLFVVDMSLFIITPISGSLSASSVPV